MKIWLRNKWYTFSDELLVIYLSDNDKKNIVNMSKDCHIYAEFNEKIFDIEKTIKLLKKLKKEAEKKNDKTNTS